MLYSNVNLEKLRGLSNAKKTEVICKSWSQYGSSTTTVCPNASKTKYKRNYNFDEKKVDLQTRKLLKDY